MQLSIIFFALGATLLIAPPADAFYHRLRAGRDIAHNHRCSNCPPDCPENLGGLLPIHDGKYSPVGKSAHYHPRPSYYENQPPYNIQPVFDGQHPPRNAPPVVYDGPPPSYDAPTPPLSFDPPPPPYNAPPPPPQFNAPMPPYHAPPPPPSYNAPPPLYNSLPPPPRPLYSTSPREAPPPPSIYVPPLYNSAHAPFTQVAHPPSFNLPSTHQYAPAAQEQPFYERPSAQDNSQTSIQLIYESPDKKNCSSPSSLNSKDVALKSDLNESSTSSPTDSTASALNSQKTSLSNSESSPSLSPSEFLSNSASESPFQDQIQGQIPNEPTNNLGFNLPPYFSYNSQPAKTFQATLAYEQNPPQSDFRPDYRPIASNYDRPPSHSFFNRIPRNFDYESFSMPEQRPPLYYQSNVEGYDFDYGKTLPELNEFEGDVSHVSYENEQPRMDRHYENPGDENPYKPYRPYKRHDNYIQNHYDLENERYKQYQSYVDSIREQPAGMEISEEQLESIIKKAIFAVRQEEAEELARQDRYHYESPYAAERPDFVTMQQPKRYQLEPYGSEEPEAREIEWTTVDSVTEGVLGLGDAGLGANAEVQPQGDLLVDMEQPPPTVTEPTIVDLLKFR